jgi:hypothetical protein
MGMRGLNVHTFLLFVGQSVGTNPHPRKRVGDFTNKIQIIVNGENGERIHVSPKRRKTLYIKIRDPIHQKYKANESMSRQNPKKK